MLQTLILRAVSSDSMILSNSDIVVFGAFRVNAFNRLISVQYYLCIVIYSLQLSEFQKLSNIMSRVVRKPAFCICENKDADQLRDYREADQRLGFRYIDNTIPLLA